MRDRTDDLHPTDALGRGSRRRAGSRLSKVGWIDDEREVMPDERAFSNWLLDEHPEFSQVHFHSRRTVRCGITILQRSAPLPRPPEPDRVSG